VIDILSENLGVDGNPTNITLESLEARNTYLNLVRQLHTVNEVLSSLIECQYEDLNAGVETMGEV
jgi:hypothetical protein